MATAIFDENSFSTTGTEAVQAQPTPLNAKMVPDAPFLSWCESRGIASPLQLQGIDSNYRYLTSPTDLPAGSILSVPLDACLVANTKETLAEKLLHEKSLGPKSEYAPYLQMLPPDLSAFKDFPRFWTDERRDLLFGLDGGEVERRIATDERKELDPWAYACVSSRANFLSDYRYSITPLLDFLNHDPSVATSAAISEDGILDLATNRSWKAEEEVKISYGALSNIDTLCDYGFVTENNPCNIEMVEIRLMGSPSVAVAVYPDSSVDKSAIYMLRENLATPDEKIMAMSREESALMKFAKPISDRNELDVYSLLASFLDDAASTSASGADDIGKSDVLMSRYLSARAISLRKGIAKILEKYPDLEY